MDYTPTPFETRPFTEVVEHDDGSKTIRRFGHAAPFRPRFDPEEDGSELLRSFKARLQEWKTAKGEPNAKGDRLLALLLTHERGAHGLRCAIEDMMDDFDHEIGPSYTDVEWERLEWDEDERYWTRKGRV